MTDPDLTYSDYILEKMPNTKVRDLNDIIEFVAADDSELTELTELTDDEDIDQHDEVEPTAESDQSTYEDESTNAEDAIPLSAISAAKKHVY